MPDGSPETRFANRYLLEGELGRGGMGRVLLALDSERDHRPVALKLLRVDPTSENTEALAREFELLTRLRHPNLIEVYDYAVSPECFFSMEYVEGRDLRATPLDDTELAEVMVQICRALEYIHSRGLVHLDIKPSNALVMRQSGGLAVKLMDFGVSTFSNNTRLRGYTVGYVAPEVLEGRDFDGRADLFALGMTIGLVRRDRMVNDDDTATQPISTTGEGVSRSALPPRNYELIPENLRPIIERLVRREPSERFATAAQVIEALAQATGRAIPVETAATRAGYLAATRLAGRAREWERLAAAWERAIAEHACTARIAGRSGVGKSRLTNELRLRAQLAGAIVVETSAAPDDAQSYGVVRRWVQALYPLCGGDLDAETQRELDRFYRQDPQRSLGEWTSEAAGGRLVDAVLTMIAHVAQKRPLLLVVEDEQWVDPASRSVLERLRAAIGDRGLGRLLLVATERSDDLETKPLGAVGSDDVIVLGPLDRDGTCALLLALLDTPALPETIVDRIAEAAAGSSLYVCELLRWLADREILSRTADRWSFDETKLAAIELPADPEALIDARIAALPDALVAMLGDAAMLGEVFAPSVLELIPSAQQTRVALLELTARNFLVAEGRRLRFGHALIREAAMRRHARRPDAAMRNRQLADALAAKSGDPAEVARLHLLSDEPTRAMPALRTAIDRARALFDYHGAAQLLLAARTLAEQHPAATFAAGTTRATLTIEWLEALRRAARPDPIDQVAIRALADSLPDTQNGSLRLELAELLLSRAAYDDSAQQASAALQLLANAPPRILAKARRTLGLARYHQGRLQDALAELDQAVNVVAPSGDSLALSAALNDRGFVYGYTGDYRRAVEDHTRALYEQSQLTESEEVHFARAATENNLGFACWSLGRYDLGRRHLGEALRLRRLIRDRHGEAVTLNNLGNVARHVGQLDEAAHHYQAAIAMARATGNALYEAIAQNNLGQIWDERGKHDDAEALYRAALATVRRLGDRIREGDNLGSLGACLLSRGDRRSACSVLEQAIAVRRAIGDRAYLVIDLSFLAVALAEERRPAEATAAIDDAVQGMAAIGEGIEQVQLVHWNLARAHRALGDAIAADQSLAQARTVLQQLAAAIPTHERDAFLQQRLHRQILEGT